MTVYKRICYMANNKKRITSLIIEEVPTNIKILYTDEIHKD